MLRIKRERERLEPKLTMFLSKIDLTDNLHLHQKRYKIKKESIRKKWTILSVKKNLTFLTSVLNFDREDFSNN